MRIKYFDDTKKNVDGTFELLRWIIDFNEEWFIRGHKGWLAPIKRALQSDLGIFLYGDHIIGSTHIEMFNMGYGKKDLPETSSEISKELRLLSRTIGESLGRYLGQLCSFPEFIPDNSLDTAFSYNINDKKLKYKDVKSKKFFNTIFNSNETIDINFSLSLFLSSLNFLQHIFRNILFGSPPTMFKLKFITLFHLASSLEKLRNYYYPKGILTSRSVKYLQEILGDDNLKVVSRQKKFRNNMVHYKIDGVAEELLNQNVNLYGLIEYYFDGKSYDDVDKIIDYQIERISAILEEWLTWKLTSNQLSSW